MTKYLAIAAAALLVGGCSTAQAQDTGKDDAYVAVVHAVLPSLDRSDIVTAGHAICGGLDAKPDLDGYATMVQTASKTSDVLKGRVMVDGAVGAYCPQHDDLRQQFAKSVGS